MKLERGSFGLKKNTLLLGYFFIHQRFFILTYIFMYIKIKCAHTMRMLR